MSSNDEVQVTAYGGGVIRIQHGVDAEQQQREEAGSSGAKHYTGSSLTFDGSTGQVQAKEALRVNAGSSEGAQGVLATARTPYGSVARELTPSTIVEAAGISMRLQDAEAAGLVRRNEFGRYVEASAVDHGQQQQAQAVEVKQHPTEGGDIAEMKPELFTGEIESMLAGLVEGVPPQMVNQVLMDAALQAARTGSLDGLNLGDVVSKTGLSPENAKAFMQSSIALLSAQADHALQQLQCEPSEFVEWARRERPEAFKQALVQHVSVRSLAGYRNLAKDFLKSTTPDADSLNRAGYETRMDPTGKELLVKYSGVWMSARAAALQGLI
jgi:hypothetical protein